MSLSLLNNNNSFKMDLIKDNGSGGSGSNLSKLKHLCEICHKEFASKYNLTRHFSEYHLKEKKVNCSLCGKEFAKKCNLTRHLREFHQKTKKFVCPKCGTELCSSYNLKRHRERVHDKMNGGGNSSGSGSEDNINVTQHSSRGGPSSSNNLNPSSISQLIQLNKCPYEGWEFPSREHLEAHIVQVHSNTINSLNNAGNPPPNPNVKVKTHICKICNKAFAEKSHLTKHTKIHNKHLQQNNSTLAAQNVQTSGASSSSSANTPSSASSSSSPYKCEICGKSYTSWEYLDFHLKDVHNSSAPHSTHNHPSTLLPHHLNMPSHPPHPSLYHPHGHHPQIGLPSGNSRFPLPLTTGTLNNTSPAPPHSNSANNNYPSMDKIFNFCSPVIPEHFQGSPGKGALSNVNASNLIKRFEVMNKHSKSSK